MDNNDHNGHNTMTSNRGAEDGGSATARATPTVTEGQYAPNFGPMLQGVAHTFSARCVRQQIVAPLP